MNKARKKTIRNIISKLNGCADELEDVSFDENYARENTPENLQESETYRNSEECSGIIEDAISDIRSVINSLEEI